MSRTKRERRLHWFNLGNERCPICLALFTEATVRDGDEVSIEHDLAKSLGGRESCLTCRACNADASKMENDAAVARRERQAGSFKVALEVPELDIHTAWLSTGEGRDLKIKLGGLRVTPETFGNAFLSASSFKIKTKTLTEHYESVPWLKAAYLMVFSLLGNAGYRWAKSKAVEQVRQQIREPKKKIIHNFCSPRTADLSEWKEVDGIAMNRRQRPSWVVKIQDRVVLLPIGCDESLYEWTSSLPREGEITIGGGPLFYPVQFGESFVFLATFREGNDPGDRAGTDLFGSTGRVEKEGMELPFAVADYGARHLTGLFMKEEETA